MKYCIITVMIEAKLKSVLPDLGRTLRLFREKSGRNLEAVAKGAGISISMLSQIERGVVSPSIDTLFMVCDALKVEMADLFGRLSPDSPVRVHKGGERLTMKNGGVRYEQLMISRRSAFPAEMVLIEVEKECATAMSGGGHEGSEMAYVLSGSARLSIGTQEYTVAEGDSICFDARLPHQLQNIGRKTFRAVWSISPPHVDYLKGNK
jgi:transcriptional regulator with XRE-family HTH domain